eukprot:GHRQ01000551.1.p2 GENE.GHRQ01000551.1~~GHRQ01000551.1.p2  ORF type:complete len:207 (+),score=58.44 GHRQ01000551.1:248-868(+)
MASATLLSFQSSERMPRTESAVQSNDGSPVMLPAACPAASDQRLQRTLPTAAAARHARFQPPLQAPVKQPSHTCISIPLGSIDLYGNYSVQGPAIIRKMNNALVALVQPGGAVSVLCNAEGPMMMSPGSLSRDDHDDEAALCHLMGQHLELDGLFEFQGTEAGHQQGIQHDGKTILSLASLPDDACITLLPGGSVSHPVNVHPRPR